MPIQPETFPILTPGQMNPWNQALSAGLDTYQNMQKAAYAPAQYQADIFSKYAAPFQSMTALLTNPYTAPLLSDTQRQQMMNAISGMSQNMGTSMGGFGQQSSQPGLLTQLWNHITGGGTQPDVLHGTSQSSQGPQVAGGGSPPSQQPGMTNAPAGTNVTNQQADIPTVKYNGPQPGSSQVTSGGTPVVTTAGGSNTTQPTVQNAMTAKSFPESQQGISLGQQYHGAITYTEEEKKDNQKFLDDTNTNVAAAQNAERDLINFKTDYTNATLKGQPLVLAKTAFGDWVTQIDPDTYSAYNDANKFVLDTASSLGSGTGKNTKYMTQLVQNSKVSPEMPVSTVGKKIPFQQIILDRSQEQSNFNAMENQYGVYDHNTLRNDWFNYNDQYRLLNDQDKLLTGNLNKYPEFLKDRYGGGNQNTAIPYQTQSNTTNAPAAPANAKPVASNNSWMNAHAYLSPAAKIIANNPPKTSWASPQEFQNWFSAQPKPVQDGVTEYLRRQKVAAMKNAGNQ